MMEYRVSSMMFRLMVVWVCVFCWSIIYVVMILFMFIVV